MKTQLKDVKNIAQIIIPLAAMLILTAVAFSSVLIVSQAPLRTMEITWHFNIAVDMFGMVAGLIIIFTCLMEINYTEQTNAFMRLVSVIILNMFWDLCCWSFDGAASAFNVKMVNTLYYLTGYLVGITFWLYIRAELSLKDHRFHFTNCSIYVAGIIGLIAVAVNWKTGFLFTVTEDAVYHRASLNGLCFVPAVYILLIVAIKIFKQKISVADKMILLSYEIFPCFAMIFQLFKYGLSILYPSALLGALLVYGNIYIQRSRKVLEQQAKLSEQNVQIMVSQIQPHFLYNTLTTISNLCRKDPEKAEEATVMFSRYLRMNLDSLKKMEPVPFSAELDHVKIYLSLEKERFDEKLTVEYDIETTNFMIPALSIQPIVENSVKHGICEKEEPGTVKIITRENDDSYQVIVEDDGVGFDTTQPMKQDGRSHVGMQNVIDRLDKMVDAEVNVVSSPGNGCCTTITIPKKERTHN